jgi:hypothetical protein
MTKPKAELKILPDPIRGAATEDGPLRSAQEADVSLTKEELEELWRPETLERLARAYWRFLETRSLHALKVEYGPNDRSVVLGSKKLTLLRFRAPNFDRGPGFGRVTWRIERGVLVAPEGRGRGFLRFDVRRLGEADDGREHVRIRIEVSNFYPMLRGSGKMARFGAFFYGQTQARLHTWMTHGFLKSLATLDLPDLRPERREAYE